MQKLLFMACTVLLMAASCSKSKTEKEPDKSCSSGDEVGFVLNNPFLLCWNYSIPDVSQNFQVGFKKVVEDSRCPTDVDCVRAGTALVALVFSHNGEIIIDTLGIGDVFGTSYSDSTFFAGYKIKLLEVLPAPISTNQPTEADYKVKLLITN